MCFADKGDGWNKYLRHAVLNSYTVASERPLDRERLKGVLR